MMERLADTLAYFLIPGLVIGTTGGQAVGAWFVITKLDRRTLTQRERAYVLAGLAATGLWLVYLGVRMIKGV